MKKLLTIMVMMFCLVCVGDTTDPIEDYRAFLGLDIGHASDTTIARSSAGRITVEGESVAIGQVFDVRDYGATGDGVTDDEVAIEAAITAAAVNGGTVLFPSTGNPYKFTTAITVPSNVTIQFEPGASLMGDGTSVLTCNGDISAGNHQIFQSTMTVEGAPKVDKFNVTWWGATADGTDSTAAITACLATAADISTHASGLSPTIYFPPVTGTRNGYYMADMVLTEAFHISGYGAILSAYSADGYAIDVEYASGTGARTYRPCVIEGLTIWGYGDGTDDGAADSSNGIRIDLPSQHTIIRNCTFSGTKTYAIHKVAGYGVRVVGCLFTSGDYGFYAETDNASFPPTINEIVDCEMNSFDQSAVFIGDTGDMTNLSHCVIQKNKGNGVTLAGSSDRGSYKGIHLDHVWLEGNGVQNLTPVATIVIDGVTIEPVDVYARDVTNLTFSNMRLPVTWLKASHARTFNCGQNRTQVATGYNDCIVSLDNESSVIHSNLSSYSALSDASHCDDMTLGIRIQEQNTAAGSSQPISVVTPHKTRISYAHTNLLGTDAAMTSAFTPADADSQTNSVVSGDVPMPGFGGYWTTTVDAGMEVDTSDFIQLYNNVAITKENYHVWSMAMMADGADLLIDLSWAGAPHRPRNIRLTDGVWKTITGVWGVTDSDTPDLRIANVHAANSGSLRISSMQMVAFTNMQEALEYANSNQYAVSGVQFLDSTVTATADGTGTGVIPANAKHVTITCDTATKQVKLPTPLIGTVMTLVTPTANGCELICTGSSVKINDVICSATNEAALVADSHYIATCISATEWILVGYDKLGAHVAPIVPDAL